MANLAHTAPYYLWGSGPFSARSASDKREDWPLWYIVGPDGRTNVLRFVDPDLDKFGPTFTERATAEMIVAAAEAEGA